MTAILLLCFTIIVSPVPVHPKILLPLLSQGGATQAQQVESVEATNQKPEAQTPVPLSPSDGQPQPVVLQQLGPHGGPQVLPSLQHYGWSPVRDSVMIVPLQPSVRGSQPADQQALPQQPLIFPPYGYIPLFSSPYSNQLASPYGFPMILKAPLPQMPANKPSNSPALAAETPSRAAPSGDAPQPVQQQQQQQQTHQIVYMLHQPMSSTLGSHSSEELETAAKMGQRGVYVPTLLTNLPMGAVQPGSQAAGLTNPGQAGVTQPVVISSDGVPQQTQGQTSPGPQPNTNSLPAGLERSTQEVTTAQTPIQPKLQPTQSNHV